MWCSFYVHWNFIILMRGCPSTHSAASVPRGVGWLGIPSLWAPRALYRVRVRAVLLACARVLSPPLLFGLTRCARSCCVRPPLLCSAPPGWRVLLDTLVRACLLRVLALTPPSLSLSHRLITSRTLDLRSLCYARVSSHSSCFASLSARDYTTRPVGSTLFHHVVPPYSAGLNNCTIFNGL